MEAPRGLGSLALLVRVAFRVAAPLAGLLDAEDATRIRDAVDSRVMNTAALRWAKVCPAQLT